MRGRNTENREIENNINNSLDMRKHSIIFDFTHYQKHVAFIKHEGDFKKKTIHDGMRVLVAVKI